jgi:hypothetical protein
MKTRIIALVILVFLLTLLITINKSRVGTTVDTNDLIQVNSPIAGGTITNPAIITGQARGKWFFEGSFPIVLMNENRVIIGEGIAKAEKEWMTEEFVPFTAHLEFRSDPTQREKGVLILKRDNPSGLPEHDSAIEIPVMIE